MVTVILNSRRASKSSHLYMRSGSPEPSKTPAEHQHSGLIEHTASHPQPFSSEHISPSVINTVTFKSNNSEGNEDSTNWAMRQQSSCFEQVITFNWNNHINISLKLPSHFINENNYSCDFPIGGNKTDHSSILN